jgi:hypothetical protein
MCCHHRHCGYGLIVLGLIIGTCGLYHHYNRGCHHAEFERHVAEVCVQAAREVQK